MTVLIVDDERNNRELLQVLLEKYCPKIETIYTAASVESAIYIINTSNIDVLFLDIEMPELNGFALLDRLKETHILTCMVTGYEKYAIKAIDYGVIGYILKPVDIEDLKKVVAKAHAKNKLLDKISGTSKILLTDGSKYYYVDSENIINLEVSGNYTSVYLEKGKRIHSRLTLSELESLLPKGTFFRTHRSHIVNLNYIKSISEGRTGSTKLANDMEIPIANRRLKNFISVFHNRKTTH